MMMTDTNQENTDEDDSDRTESYTPPPLDITIELNTSIEKENRSRRTSVVKRQSSIVLDQSFNQVPTVEFVDTELQSNSSFSMLTKYAFMSYR